MLNLVGNPEDQFCIDAALIILQQYEFPVEENAVFGTTVGSVYAEDYDSGSFGTIKYALEGPNSNHFFVVTNTQTQEVSLTHCMLGNGVLGEYTVYSLSVIHSAILTFYDSVNILRFCSII